MKRTDIPQLATSPGLQKIEERLEEHEEFRRSGMQIKYDEREVYQTKHEPQTPSSDGMIGTDNRKHHNPLIKAIGTQRKDFDYVTNLRREVIEIVEPFRSKVIDSEKRFELNESQLDEVIKRLNKFEFEINKQFKMYLTSERTNELYKELKQKLNAQDQQFHDRLSKCEIRVDIHHQKVTKVDNFLPMLKKFTDDFNQRQNNLNENIEVHQVKIMEQIANNQLLIREMECQNRIESSRLQQLINGLESQKVIQNQHLLNQDLKLAEMKALLLRSKVALDYDIKDSHKSFKRELEKKMWKFCDHTLKEFRFLHQKLEDKIYLELGYLDKIPKLNSHLMQPAQLDDLVSECYLSSMSWADRKIPPRPNSIGVFKGGRREKKLPYIKWNKPPRLLTPKGLERKPQKQMSVRVPSLAEGVGLKKQNTVVITRDESYMDITIKSKLKRLPSVMYKPEHFKTTKSTKEGDLGIIKIKPQEVEQLKPKKQDAKIQVHTNQLDAVQREEVMIQTDKFQVDFATQFPEKPSELTPEQAEKLWFLDHKVRQKKQVLSLEQIWRFLAQEIDKKMLLEHKIEAWERAQEKLAVIPEQIIVPDDSLLIKSPITHTETSQNQTDKESESASSVKAGVKQIDPISQDKMNKTYAIQEIEDSKNPLKMLEEERAMSITYSSIKSKVVKSDFESEQTPINNRRIPRKVKKTASSVTSSVLQTSEQSERHNRSTTQENAKQSSKEQPDLVNVQVQQPGNSSLHVRSKSKSHLAGVLRPQNLQQVAQIDQDTLYDQKTANLLPIKIRNDLETNHDQKTANLLPIKIRNYQVKKTREATVEAFSQVNTNFQIIAQNFKILQDLIFSEAKILDLKQDRTTDILQKHLKFIDHHNLETRVIIQKNEDRAALLKQTVQFQDQRIDEEALKTTAQIQSIGLNELAMQGVFEWFQQNVGMPNALQESGDSGPTFTFKGKGARGIITPSLDGTTETKFAKQKSTKLSRISKMTGNLVERNMRPGQETEQDGSVRSGISHLRSESMTRTFQSNQKYSDSRAQ